MKKFYSLMLATAGVLVLNAQAPVNVNNTTTRAAHQPQMRAGTMPAAHATTNARTGNPNVSPLNFSDWVTYADAKDNDWGGGVSELNANYLFPDSTVLGNFGTWGNVWVHNLGDVLDVASPSLTNFYNPINGYNLTRSDAYSVDSMAVLYVYDRQYSNPNIVDTLIVYMYSNATAANLTNNGFIGATAANYGTDTVSFKSMKYNGAVNMPSSSATSYAMPTGMQTFKILLTQADTSVAFWGQKAFPTNFFNVPAGKLLATSVVFKPGYTYNPGDTLDTQLNYFLFGSMEEGGGGASGGSYPLYLDCNYQASSCDYGCSYIIRTNERYNYPGNGWNGYYIPKYAFTQPYSLENHYFSYKISSPPMGVQEAEAATGMTLSQNVPNPANGSTMIAYSIDQPGKVALTIYDVTGKEVMTFDQGRQVAGSYHVDVNTANLNAGVYFYTLTLDGKSTTQRMIISN